MKELEIYTIDVAALKMKEYSYHYEIGSAFFKLFEDSLVNEGNLHVDLKLTKTETMYRLDFGISGEVKLICDRSNDPFIHTMSCTHLQILQFGDRNEDMSDELVIIKTGVSQINIAQNIYEAVILTIPMKRLHPRYDPEEEEDEVIYSSLEKSTELKDPRWDALKNLKK